MKKEAIENWMFVLISILLISFQVGLYAKACKFPDFASSNMIFLYIALIAPWVIRKTQKSSKLLSMIIFSIYLIYFILAFAGFLALINSLLITCNADFFIDLR